MGSPKRSSKVKQNYCLCPNLEMYVRLNPKSRSRLQNASANVGFIAKVLNELVTMTESCYLGIFLNSSNFSEVNRHLTGNTELN